MQEVEAKFLLPRQQFDEIKDYFTGKKKYRKCAIIPVNEEVFDTSYYDTEARHLTNAQAALRLRKIGTHYYLAFKKKQAGNDKSVQVRKENEILLAREPSFEDTSLSPIAEAHTITGQHSLRTIASMRTRRSLFYISQPHFVVEMAFDAVQVTKPQEQDFCELELELKKGDLSILSAFVEQLAADFGITPTKTTKLGRVLGIKEE